MSQTSAPRHEPFPIGEVVKSHFSTLWRVGSLGLELLVRETGFRPGSINSFLLGY
jgi:hypothetical protein